MRARLRSAACVASALALASVAAPQALAQELPVHLEAWGDPSSSDSDLDATHRNGTVADVPTLLDIAEADPARFEAVVRVVRMLVDLSDKRSDRIVRLFVDGLARREDAPKAPPRPAGSGLPSGFETLARAVWGLEGLDVHQREAGRVVPYFWLLRWAGELTPTIADVPFLDAVVDDGSGVERAWALRHRVRLAGDDAATRLRTLLEDSPDDVDAAAHLALAGDRSHWDRLAVDAPATPLIWRVAPESGVEAAAESGLDLSPRVLAEWRIGWGVDGSHVDRDAAAAAVLRSEGTSAAVRFLVTSHPRGITQELVTELAGTDESSPAWTPDLEDLAADELSMFVAIAALRAPEAAKRLATSWLRASPDLRGFAIWASLRLGWDVPTDLAWQSWWQRYGADDWSPGWADAHTLGLHADAAVVERLRGAATGDEESTSAALAALARHAGASTAECLAIEHGTRGEDWTAAPWAQLREAILDGRPRDGLRKTELLDDAPDAAALAKLLAANDTFALDSADWETLGVDGASLVPLHVPRLDHNCCSRFQAVTALKALYPTMPLANEWAATSLARVAADWLDENAERCVWSPLAEAFVPR